MESFIKMLDINLNSISGYAKLVAASFIISFVFNLFKDILHI